MSQKVSGVKGMNDLFAPEIEIWHHLEGVARELCRRYGYSEIRTPVLEHTELFARSVGEETDIVGKEMYTFDDRGGRSLSLRPEGTAGAARAYIEHSMANKEAVTRWYYLGPMFRYERMKAGRYRQFHQLGIESFGVKEPGEEVEQIDLTLRLLGQLELKGIELNLNSLGDANCRPAYLTELKGFLAARREKLCEDCQRRLDRNPLRVLDCKNETCQAVLADAPSLLDHLCPPCREHFAQVRRRLDLLGHPYRLNPRLVRGLDYYTRTAFELIAADPVLGTAGTVAGGGRYDGLVKMLGGPEIPASGLAIGLERIAMLLAASGRAWGHKPDLFIAFMDAPSEDQALKLAQALRGQGFWIELDTRGGSLKSQMKRADRTGARFALVLGQTELAEGAGQLKPMAGGEPSKVAFGELGGFLKQSR